MLAKEQVDSKITETNDTVLHKEEVEYKTIETNDIVLHKEEVESTETNDIDAESIKDADGYYKSPKGRKSSAIEKSTSDSSSPMDEFLRIKNQHFWQQHRDSIEQQRAINESEEQRALYDMMMQEEAEQYQQNMNVFHNQQFQYQAQPQLQSNIHQNNNISAQQKLIQLQNALQYLLQSYEYQSTFYQHQFTQYFIQIQQQFTHKTTQPHITDTVKYELQKNAELQMADAQKRFQQIMIQLQTQYLQQKKALEIHEIQLKHELQIDQLRNTPPMFMSNSPPMNDSIDVQQLVADIPEFEYSGNNGLQQTINDRKKHKINSIANTGAYIIDDYDDSNLLLETKKVDNNSHLSHITEEKADGEQLTIDNEKYGEKSSVSTTNIKSISPMQPGLVSTPSISPVKISSSVLSSPSVNPHIIQQWFVFVSKITTVFILFFTQK